MSDSLDRINAEWVAVNACRGLIQIASRGDQAKSSYDNAFLFGEFFYPTLLGAGHRQLHRVRESDLVREYRQKAELLSVPNNTPVNPIDLVVSDIDEYRELLNTAQKRSGAGETDQIRRKLSQLHAAHNELASVSHSETQMIFRDARVSGPLLYKEAKGYKDFLLNDHTVLRVHIFHPDQPEHITGADLVYEQHDMETGRARVAAIQYKVYDKSERLYLSDTRLMNQVDRLRQSFCDHSVCSSNEDDDFFRFPCCSAFLRPTARLQSDDQDLITKGEHIPICMIERYASPGPRGGLSLDDKIIKDRSVSSTIFQELFNRTRIGSRSLSKEELQVLHERYAIPGGTSRVVLLAQEYSTKVTYAASFA